MKTKLITATVIALSLTLSAALAAEPEGIRITPATSQPSETNPQNFSGSVQVDSRFETPTPGRVGGGVVTFEPAARTNWHTHPLGQTLIVTAGVGRVQKWGEAVQEIRPGDVVWIPPGVKHWHGASPSTGMTHVAISEQVDGKSVVWMEPVSDTQYGKATSQESPSSDSSQPAAKISRAQSLMGDITPKLAELTDDVLFGDVWERPALSKRDRSLVTVSALIAMNRPDQLRSHLTLARANGVKHEELTEAITHLAFYAGWPSAVAAAGVAKETIGTTTKATATESAPRTIRDMASPSVGE